MHSFFRVLLKSVLAFFTKHIVRKYKPKVVGITGSVGKTSAKEAIFAVLEGKFSVGKSKKNLNNEFGTPIAVSGASDPNGELFGWFRVLFRMIRLFLWRDQNYPEILILEMGADRIGDIEYLTKLVPCDIGVVTSLGPSHLEYFGTLERLVEEKAVLVRHLREDGTAVINRDDGRVWSLRRSTNAGVLTYGFDSDASVQAREVRYETDPNIGGIHFKIYYHDSEVPVFITHALGTPAVYAALAGASVGLSLGMNLVDIASGLSEFRTEPGRLNLLTGIKGTWIIDDTYNSAPASAMAALDVLMNIDCDGDRWAVLGDMLELGSETEAGHRAVGKRAAELGVDYLVTVGERSMDTLSAAREKGMSEDKSFSFDTSREAGKFLQDRMEQGDVLLIKGSQGMRMEFAVKEIMGEPRLARELLCRQDESWV